MINPIILEDRVARSLSCYLLEDCPLICLVLNKSSLAENVDLVRRNLPYIDIVELRIDYLTAEEILKASLFPSMVSVPVILTCRRVSDGGTYKEEERTRFSLMEKALDGDFSYVDIEEDVKRSVCVTKAQKKGIKVIRSLHDFNGIPDDLVHRMLQIAHKGSIPKAAVMLNSIHDVKHLFEIAKALQEVPEKILLGMGPFGVPTRILYRKLNSILTFTSPDEVAPGQFSPRTLKEVYHADTVDAKTHVYGIIGNPVLHTKSPMIHNPGFEGIHYNAVYVPFQVDAVRPFFALAEMLPIYGFSVTVPHKQAVLPYLGKVSREVKQIGACNTVVRKKNLWSGTNTDYYGFIQPLIHPIQSGEIKSVLVVGAGGAARSCVWALKNYGCRITIVNRDVEKAEKLAELTLNSFDSLDNAYRYAEVDAVIQTTNVGMGSLAGVDPIPSFPFSERHHVYELIYAPKYTALLKRAKKAGSSLYYGSQMLIGQGKLQFEAFTGYHYPKRLPISLVDKEDA